MIIKLVDSYSKEGIGNIELKFLPREKEIIQFKNETYICKYVIHSEKGVQLLVVKKEVSYDISW